MMKFMLAARRKRHETQERYFYEWGIIHVALMITTPSVMRSFKRYVQHFSVSGVGNDDLMYPLSAMEWDNMADHWIDDYEDLIRPNMSDDYMLRMQPHNFGDAAFALEMTRGHIVYEMPNFACGGVNLVHFIKKRPEISQSEFARRWRDEHAPLVMDTLGSSGLLRKYVQNAQLPMDPAIFKGTFFEVGGVGQHAGIEQYWFKDVEDLKQLRHGGELGRKIRASSDRLYDPADTFSMVTTERVIYDYTVPGRESPRPAVLNPDSLESRILQDGFRDWHIPKPPG
jgi:hypothetical protein